MSQVLVLSVVEAIREIEEAAFDAGVNVPISAAQCEKFIFETVQLASDEAPVGSRTKWWSILVNDSEDNGMYVSILVDKATVQLRAGKGDGAALKRFADHTASRPYTAAIKLLESRFGRPFWTGAVALDELH
ncbi:MAG: hypothetical protein MUC96_28220 [Myxococcaceae bacterium]|nr:hypothetical protein [Myxococcaceae bacterium]